MRVAFSTGLIYMATYGMSPLALAIQLGLMLIAFESQARIVRTLIERQIQTQKDMKFLGDVLGKAFSARTLSELPIYPETRRH